MAKCVILAGGRGSRLGNLGETLPKPMIEIGGIPIIDHIMNKFMRDVGECEFIVAGGYRCDVLQEHLDKYSNVKVIYTGKESHTAGRLKRLAHLLDEPFYACYGDGLTDFKLKGLKTNNLATILAVRPIGRFGELEMDASGNVTSFKEKPSQKIWINGGFFYFHPNIFSYIKGEDEDLASNIFPKVAEDKNLFGIRHEGYWHCMDTPRDYYELNEQIKTGKAQWLK